MGDKMTRVRIPEASVVDYVLRGHVPHDEAVKQAARHWEGQLQQAQAALDAIRSGRAQVTHQRGIYRVTDVKVVEPPARAAG